MHRSIYALDGNHLTSVCSHVTPLELQPLFMYHNDHMWLYRIVPAALYIHYFKVGHDVQGQSWTEHMSVMVQYNQLEGKAKHIDTRKHRYIGI